MQPTLQTLSAGEDRGNKKQKLPEMKKMKKKKTYEREDSVPELYRAEGAKG